MFHTHKLLAKGCIIVATFSCLAASHVRAATVSYDSLGTYSTPALNHGGVTVTGPADVYVLNLNGLGIVGGLHDSRVDYLANEYINFSFNSTPAKDITYFMSGSGQSAPYNSTVGERTLEAFALNGSSLGTFTQDDGGYFPVSSLFSNVPIKSFRLTALPTDNFQMSSISYTPVPLPAAAWMALPLLGVMCVIGKMRRRRCA